ncbi:hypothetical protein DEI92_03120 [Curtobacterium sp. MCBD17_034]|uniref:hypothetical protein n=1 Tax=unclassified Curtobacterium TaxID=257496 RepID=UPI000DA92FB4|nr:MULTISPECIES: hypothetical protein [unclassified Curtobacterium]PZE27907.1 hypothetical protein DEI86_04740 [Curtobacterium sp. MCBD17_028]PZE78324.1 hypothetical protein DEI82_00660 [Curtobacterium sp. MCBD17_019]PZM39807.1 hypothetical protein DEI90_02985 [Curtobacterium sp. MCBD17_031]PZF59464.1 hypothetical protein DEI81_13820 [Curtobacterium sp. MCBD17_013]PZF62486.1 hypothetical protein DEI92_03120 [Curtobacterium sp. MCBD17_034]
MQPVYNRAQNRYSRTQIRHMQHTAQRDRYGRFRATWHQWATLGVVTASSVSLVWLAYEHVHPVIH